MRGIGRALRHAVQALHRRRTSVQERELAAAQSALVAIAAALRQVPPRKMSVAISAAASKIVAAGAAGGVYMAIAAFGAAGNGVAIATLWGAAANSAVTFWIGSIFGLGAIAGGAILTGGALLTGIAGAWGIRRWLFGKQRHPSQLGAHEQAAIDAAEHLAQALAVMRQQGNTPSRTALAYTAHAAMIPLAAACRSIADRTAPATKEEPCNPRTSSLAWAQRWRLRSAASRIERIATGWSPAKPV